MLQIGASLKSRAIVLAASFIIATIGIGLYFKSTIVSIACNTSGHLAQADTCERQDDSGQIYFASCSGFF